MLKIAAFIGELMFCFFKNWKSRKSNREILESIMATVEQLVVDIKASLQEAKDNQVETSGKLDAVITKLTDLVNAGQGANADQLTEVLSMANDVKGGVQSMEDKLDAVGTVATA